MARDYAKRPKKRKKSSSGVSSWVWLLTGLLVGLVLAAIAYLKLFVHGGNIRIDSGPIAKQTISKKESSKPKFDFYTLLPEMEVEVPDAQPPAAIPPSQPQVAELQPAPSKALDAAKYRLQLASFKKFDEADSMKARLALEGIFVEIQTVKLDSGQTWYRVRTTQFEDRDDALTLQKSLQRQAISSMLLKDS
jgi:cell division protein FtsN